MTAIPDAKEIPFELERRAPATPAPVAHGPSGALELPDWPPLTIEEANAVLAPYTDTGEALRLLSVSPRPFSAASVVETSRGSVFIKKHSAAVRTVEGLREEHELQEYLFRARWPDDRPLVQAALRDRIGNTVQQRGEWVYEVHPVAFGADTYRDAHSWTPFSSVSHARAAGRALATFHRAVKGYKAPARATRPLVTSWTIFAADDPVQAMDAYLKKRPALEAYAEERCWRESMRELLLPWHAKLRRFLPALDPLWTHNDFHASNLMWADPESGNAEPSVTAIVDFGLSDRTNAVHDIATAIERNAIEWLRISESRIVHLDHVEALLAGYQEMRPLRGIEAEAIARMLPLVHCEFALSETDYFLSVLNDHSKAFLGYEGYFLGHAAWFRGGEGTELLEHLTRWAQTVGPVTELS